MTDYKEASRRAFDKQAEQYDASEYGRHARLLYPVLLAQLSQIPHRSVLDVGCGTGEMLRMVEERWPGTALAGLDLSQQMLEVAREKLPGSVELVQGDAAQLPFAQNRFDVVLCNDSFHHYPDPAAVLTEVARVLQPGGVLLLGDCMAPAGLRGLTNLFLPLSQEGDVHLYSPKELEALLGRYFSGVECRRVNATSLIAWGIG